MSTVFANDPQIKYSSGWDFDEQRFPGVRWTEQSGSTATYIFNGTRIEVLGTKSHHNSNSTATLTVDSQEFDSLSNNGPLLSLTNLTRGVHTLVIKSRQGLLMLNSIVVDDFLTPSAEQPSTASLDPTASQRAPSQPGQSVDNTEASGSPSQANNIGRIVGGAVAGVVILLLIGLSFCMLRRRKRKHGLVSAEPNLAPIPFRIEEFLAPLHEAERSPASVPTMTLSRASAIAGSLTILDTGSTNNNQEMSRSSSIYKEVLDDGRKPSVIPEPQAAEPPGGDLESLRTTWSEAPPSYKS
ncbi:hypothetical protein VKT23_001925 [Stygiomarasmius scandens]|uniref:Uncharacterized protein n=1 Tax=Marasmiellus scandens TaxID=2682957 RepID=A0ABR1K0P1_9AGAR